MDLHLLIVDDDVQLCQTLKSFFERQGYRVSMAHDGPQALDLVEHQRPHLVFLDIGMPGMSGVTVLQKIKSIDPSVRVIMVTGQTEEDLMAQCTTLGADDYVVKPFALSYLSGEVMDKLHRQLFTELRSTSTDLVIEREKAGFILDQIQEAVLLTDSAQVLTYANPMARALLGIESLDPPLTLEAALKGYRFPSPNPFHDLDAASRHAFDILREEPKRMILECRFNPLYGTQKKQVGYVGLLRDVTLERKAETAMHRFISMVSHKLRTPLVTIRAYPRLLLSDTQSSPLNDFQRNAIQVILSQCLRMETLVNQLIAFCSVDPNDLSRQPVSLIEMLHEVEKTLPEIQNQKPVTMNIETNFQHSTVEVDPALMTHAFRSIVENAFKFGAKRIDVGNEIHPEHITVWFRDDGNGIPPEDRDRIFEKFYQVEKDFSGQVPGAGLGLSMVKQTVEAHGGKVWVTSEVGKGSCFFVKLPPAKS